MTDTSTLTSLADQLEYHWTQRLRPRLDGLSDHEYARWVASVRSLGAELALLRDLYVHTTENTTTENTTTDTTPKESH